MDLEEWLAERRYGQLLDLILQLPDPDSRFYTALQQPKHEDLYKLILGDPAAEKDATESETDSEPTTPYQHAGLAELLLMDVLDSMNMHRSEAAVKGTGKQPRRIKKYPRPQGARDRILARVANRDLDELARDLGYGDET